MRCPTCGGNVLITDKSYICGCVTVPKVILGKVITPEVVHELLTNRQTKILDGFVSRRNGKVFSAALAIENGRVKFRFGGNKRAKKTEQSKVRCTKNSR